MTRAYPDSSGQRDGSSQTVHSRACPDWSPVFHSWSFNTYNSTRTNLRRLSMWTILVLRLAMSFLMIVFLSFGRLIGSTIAGSILLVLNLVFMVWCLAMIDQAEGCRKVLGLKLVSWNLFSFIILFFSLYPPKIRVISRKFRMMILTQTVRHVRSVRGGTNSTYFWAFVPCFTWS